MAKRSSTPAWAPRQFSTAALVKALVKLGAQARHGEHPDVGLVLHVLAGALAHDEKAELSRMLSEARKYAHARHEGRASPADRDRMLVGPQDPRERRVAAYENALERTRAYLRGENEEWLDVYENLGNDAETIEARRKGSPKAHPADLKRKLSATMLSAIDAIQPGLLDDSQRRKAWGKGWLAALTKRLGRGKGTQAGKLIAVVWDLEFVLEDALDAAGVSAAVRAKINEARKKSLGRSKAR